MVDLTMLLLQKSCRTQLIALPVHSELEEFPKFFESSSFWP
jgi:hypothetical protein